MLIKNLFLSKKCYFTGTGIDILNGIVMVSLRVTNAEKVLEKKKVRSYLNYCTMPRKGPQRKNKSVFGVIVHSSEPQLDITISLRVAAMFFFLQALSVERTPREQEVVGLILGRYRPKSLRLVVMAFSLGAQDNGNSTTTVPPVSG